MTEWLPHGVGKLAATMLGVGVAQRADSQRFSRGRTYQRQGAVIELTVTPGHVRARVQGSRGEPYAVTVIAPRLSRAATGRLGELPATSPQRYSALVPDAAELRFSCTCPDWDDPCKHAVAVVVELGERVARDPRLLERWRDGDGDSESDESAVDIEARDDAAGAIRPTPQAPELVTFFAAPQPIAELPAVEPLPLPARRWDQPWADVLAEALDVLSRSDAG